MCAHIVQVHICFKEQILTKTILNIISFTHNGTTESTISFNDTIGFELLKFRPSRNNHFSLCHTVWIIYC